MTRNYTKTLDAHRHFLITLLTIPQRGGLWLRFKPGETEAQGASASVRGGGSRDTGEDRELVLSCIFQTVRFNSLVGQKIKFTASQRTLLKK